MTGKTIRGKNMFYYIGIEWETKVVTLFFFIKIISLISVIIQMYFEINKLFQIELELFMYIKNYIFK